MSSVICEDVPANMRSILDRHISRNAILANVASARIFGWMGAGGRWTGRRRANDIAFSAVAGFAFVLQERKNYVSFSTILET